MVIQYFMAQLSSSDYANGIELMLLVLYNEIILIVRMYLVSYFCNVHHALFLYIRMTPLAANALFQQQHLVWRANPFVPVYKWVDPLGDAIPLYNHSHPCIPHSVVNVLVCHLHVLACTFLSAAAADCVSTHFFIHCRLIFLNLLHCELSPLGLNNHVLKCLLGYLVSGSVWVVACSVVMVCCTPAQFWEALHSCCPVLIVFVFPNYCVAVHFSHFPSSTSDFGATDFRADWSVARHTIQLSWICILAQLLVI